MSQALSGWNLEYDASAIEAGIAGSKNVRKGDGRICSCGHNARSHGSQAMNDSPNAAVFKARGVEICSPGRMTCPCQVFEAVVDCDDVRLFLFKTEGSYNSHALTRGIHQAISKGVRVEPIGDWTCRACKRGAAEGVTVGPVPVNAGKQEAGGPAPYNMLLCGDCVDLLRHGTLFA